jgi:hypothetical protein
MPIFSKGEEIMQLSNKFEVFINQDLRLIDQVIFSYNSLFVDAKLKQIAQSDLEVGMVSV